jgi:hypothetical protein
VLTQDTPRTVPYRSTVRSVLTVQWYVNQWFTARHITICEVGSGHNKPRKGDSLTERTVWRRYSIVRKLEQFGVSSHRVTESQKASIIPYVFGAPVSVDRSTADVSRNLLMPDKAFASNVDWSTEDSRGVCRGPQRFRVEVWCFVDAQRIIGLSRNNEWCILIAIDSVSRLPSTD